FLLLIKMKNITSCLISLVFVLAVVSCNSTQENVPAGSAPKDTVFLQDYSIKYYFNDEVVPKKVFEDRNGTIQILTEEGLYRPHAGEFLYPGELVLDRTYLPMADKKISGMGTYQNQFVYVDDEAVLGNAWAG